MWCVPSHRPRATVSLLLALRDERRVTGPGEGVRRTREVRAIDRGGDPALRGVLRAGRGRPSASARRILGNDPRVTLTVRLPARKVDPVLRQTSSLVAVFRLSARISSNR